MVSTPFRQGPSRQNYIDSPGRSPYPSKVGLAKYLLTVCSNSSAPTSIDVGPLVLLKPSLIKWQLFRYKLGIEPYRSSLKLVLKVTLVTVFIVVFSQLLKAQEVPQFFMEGSKQYQQQNYAGAVSNWTRQLKADPLDTNVLFNLSLAFSNQQKWGLALAHLYELHLLDPRHTKANQVANYIDSHFKSMPSQIEDSFLSLFDRYVGGYFLLQEILFAHFVLSLTLLIVLAQLFRERRLAPLREMLPPPWEIKHWSFIFLWVGLTLTLFLKIWTSTYQKGVIITPGNVAIRSGPLSDAAELTSISEGSVVLIKDYYKDWLQVQFGRAPVGWIERKNLALLTSQGLR